MQSGGHALTRGLGESQDSQSTNVIRTTIHSETPIPARVTLLATLSLIVRLHQPLEYHPGRLEGIPTLRRRYLRFRQVSLNVL